MSCSARTRSTSRLVADVAVHEADALLEVGQAGPVARVGQRVVHHHAIVGMGRHAVADEVGPDEPGSAGDQHGHRTNTTALSAREASWVGAGTVDPTPVSRRGDRTEAAPAGRGPQWRRRCRSRHRRDAGEGGPGDQGHVGALERGVLLDAGAPADPPLEELGCLLLPRGVEHLRGRRVGAGGVPRAGDDEARRLELGGGAGGLGGRARAVEHLHLDAGGRQRGRRGRARRRRLALAEELVHGLGSRRLLQAEHVGAADHRRRWSGGCR